MSPAGFEPAIPAIERPQTYALDHVATDIDRPTESLLRFSAQILYMCSWIHVQSHKMWSQCLFTSAPQLLKNWWLFSCLLVNMFRDH